MSNEVGYVVTLIRLMIVVGFAVLFWHSKWMAAQWWELVKPVWFDTRKWCGQRVIAAGVWFIRAGARLSGVYRISIKRNKEKKLEMSYE